MFKNFLLVISQWRKEKILLLWRRLLWNIQKVKDFDALILRFLYCALYYLLEPGFCRFPGGSELSKHASCTVQKNFQYITSLSVIVNIQFDCHIYIFCGELTRRKILAFVEILILSTYFGFYTCAFEIDILFGTITFLKLV